LIISGNDAAVALAEATGGSVAGFVDMMNAKAKELGLKNTHFVNPHGVNKSAHYSSARDLATMAKYARTFPLFKQIVDSKGFCLPTIPGQPPRRWDSGNELVNQVGWVTGIKTGSTPYARYCLVASGTQEGMSMISVVLGADTSDTRWKESRRLLEYGFSLRPKTLLVGKGEPVLALDVPDVMGRTVKLIADTAMAVHLKKGDMVTRSVVIDREPAIPVGAGEVFGHVQFTLGGRSLGSVNLVAAQPVTRPTLGMIRYYWRARSPVRLIPQL
jgi:D-alanyl-D-alanine carboxypeptidase (penicillin-binding protein 5/6)